MNTKKNYLVPIYNKSVVQEVIDRITGAIISGELKPGDKIPTEPELVERFSVGRNSIREAIRILVSYGVLEIKRPEGTFVCDGFSTKMINPLLYSIILQKENSYNDLIGLRRLIETGIMKIVVEQGLSEEQEESIDKKCNLFIKILDESPNDITAILNADISLHEEVAKATKNELIIKINEVVSNLTRSSREKTIENVISKNQADYLKSAHIKLVNALKSRSMNDVDKALEDSYLYWKDIYK